jgi:Domain of unknown function (DUF4157)
VGSMARHNLAARSLRHLRFAHRMMVGQPLLARASHSSYPPTSIALDGYQLPLGRILRRLPLDDAMWTTDVADGETGAAPVADVAPPAETLLRLLPRLAETHDADTTSAAPGDDMGAPPATTRLSGQTDARRVADDASAAPTTTPPTVPPARSDGVRPRSRIVELPGTVSLPVEETSPDEPRAPDIPEESPEDVPENARAEFLADAHETSESAPEQQPLMREADEQVTTTSREPAKTAVEQVTPVSPVPPAASASTPRRRGRQPSATPPRASDALFPPTDDDRSPAAWLARLQHAEEPTPPTPPEPSAAPVKPDNETSSAPVQRPGARDSRKGANRAQASTTATPETHTTSARSQSPEQSSQSQSEERPATLPGSSRALLHTLTGVDPASARVYRGPVAERAASAQNADALTDGSAIALGAGHATDTPETLGLLAHELTHVAQRRSTRFVPPVAQPPHHQHRVSAGTSSPVAQGSHPAASPADEEAQATQVEARVTRIARAKTSPPHAIQPALPVESDATTPPARETPMRPGTQPVWGNLPAPWEPLPDWMTSPAESSVSAPQPASHPQATSSAPARAPSANTPGMQRAERGRSLAAEVEESSPSHTRETPAPEPDLDLLAQQVHAILKRRLAAERRRFG